MRRIKKVTAVAVLAASLLTLCGCANLLIAENEVFTLNGEMPQTAYVESMVTDQPGKVCSITPDGEYLLSIGKNNNLYTIDQYQTSRSTLINITTSDTAIYDVQTAKDGFFYTKENPSDLTKMQIVWSTFDKSIERTITDSSETPSEHIFAYGNDSVVYVNNGNELVFSDSNAAKRRYSFNAQLEVDKINWSKDKNIGFLIGRGSGDEYFTLFHLLLTNNELKVNPIAIQIIDMDLSRTTNQLAYIIQEDDGVQVYNLNDINTVNSTKLFKDTNIEKIAFSDDAKALYYSKTIEPGVRSTIWHYDNESGNRYQLTSPIRLNSVILPLIQSNAIFYSASQLTYLESSDIILSYSYITKLEYSLPSEENS